MARESSRLPTSARPNVSSRPVESAMQNDANCRFAVRMNRAPSVWEDMKAEILQAHCPPSRLSRFGASRRSSLAFRWLLPLPVSRPPGALQIAEPCHSVRQRQLARRPLLCEHRLAVVEVPDLDADAAGTDARVDRRRVLPDAPDTLGSRLSHVILTGPEARPESPRQSCVRLPARLPVAARPGLRPSPPPPPAAP